jgi:hypothetical protein
MSAYRNNVPHQTNWYNFSGIYRMLSSRLKIFSLFLLLSGLGNSLAAQRSNSVGEKIQEKRYVFIPQSVSPLSGGNRQLFSDFSLRISPDSIISYLPYFGRAFSASIGTSQSGLSFTSTDFSYEVTGRKKGGWNITLKPRQTDVRVMNLTVFPNGTATLQVTSNNRQAISFYGFIDERELKKVR